MLNPRQLNSIMDSIPALVSYINKEGIYTYANQTYEEWFGKPKDSVVGKSFKEVLGPEKYKIVEEKVKRALAGEVVEYEAFVRYEGGDKHVRANYIPDLAPDTGDVLGFIVLVQDITATKKEALALDSKLKHLHQEKNDSERVVSMFTHDMRSPLTSAKLSSELLLRSAKDNPKILRHAERIKVSLDRTERQIRNLLDVNRLRSGRTLSLNIEEVELRPEIMQICEEFTKLYGEGLHLTKNLEEICVKTDKNALQRAVDILLANCTKDATQAEVFVSLKEQGSDFRLEIHNKNSFISSGELEKVFSEEQQIGQAEEDGKWRLNLSIVKGLAESLGGSIDVESSREEGTSFVLILPKDSSSV